MFRLHFDGSNVLVWYIQTYPALDTLVTLALIMFSVVSSAFCGAGPGSGAGVARCICCKSIPLLTQQGG